MSNETPHTPQRPPNRGFRPPPGEYADAQKQLQPGQSMTEYLRAALRWLSARPEEAHSVLAPYWPDSRTGRPHGARDRQPRRARGSASEAGRCWWALWDGGELLGTMSGPADADRDEVLATFTAGTGLDPDGDYLVERCDDDRAAALEGWNGKSEQEKATLRHDQAGTA